MRYYMCLLFLLGMGLQKMHRVAFTIGLTEIISKREVKEELKSVICLYGENDTEKGEPRVVETNKYKWDTKQEASLLSSFFYGYVFTQIPGGMLSDLFGPKRVMGYSVLLCALCSLLIPVCARINIYALMFVRALQGVAQGPMYPVKGTFIARWSLPDERRWISTILNCGAYGGYVTGQILTGVILSKSDDWDNVFVYYAVASIIWFIFWTEFVYDSPFTHPYISEEEKKLLEEGQEGEVGGMEDAKMDYWGTLTSVPMWSMVVAAVASDWMFFVMEGLLPSYMAYILQFSIEENGIVSSIPWMIGIVFLIVMGQLAYWLVHKGILSRTMQAKVFMFISNIGPCICFLIVSYGRCNRVIAIIFFSLAMGLISIVCISLHVANIDIAPNMAGFVMAIMNTMGAVCGIFVPQVYAWFITEQTIEAWREAFYFTFVVVTVLTSLYLVFGTSKVQKWNFGRKKSSSTENKEENKGGESPGE